MPIINTFKRFQIFHCILQILSGRNAQTLNPDPLPVTPCASPWRLTGQFMCKHGDLYYTTFDTQQECADFCGLQVSEATQFNTYDFGVSPDRYWCGCKDGCSMDVEGTRDSYSISGLYALYQLKPLCPAGVACAANCACPMCQPGQQCGSQCGCPELFPACSPVTVVDSIDKEYLLGQMKCHYTDSKYMA